MKAKIAAILDDVPPNETAFAKVVKEMPEIMRTSNKAATYLGSDATPEEVHLASVIRTTAQMYYSGNGDGTRGNDGYNDEQDQDIEIAMPAMPEDSLIDPRITGAISSLDAFAGHNEGYNDEQDQDREIAMPSMPEDSLIDPRITEAISGLDAVAGRNETTDGRIDVDGSQDPGRQVEMQYAANDP